MTPILEISNLSKSYRAFTAVDDLSFSVEKGEVFGFLGPNGAGKSTTIRMILSLIKPDRGDVLFHGDSLIGKNKVLRNIGALVEDADFYENLSARTNLKLLARIERIPENRVDEVIDIVGLAGRGDDKVKAYSHGMKQRLGIAQALLNQPKLLILDEPTSGLDPRGMKEIRELIRELSGEGMTIMLSSHLLAEVEKVCTSLAIINRGKLVKSGKIAELATESDLFITEIRATPLEEAWNILRKQYENLERSQDVLKVRLQEDEVPGLNRLLVESGVDVSAIIPRSSLEDYFLSITEQAEGVE
jgi:ABC-2 type transport system ATP-binding protein